ncbi:MAG: hypothetical protein LBT27_08550 [Prevotellaceae bacterium]|jgi:DNA repair exonuclease SbcCD ATPase subunit|nr:hypothetical protein [Prevotellaceae bacterium]
MWSYCKKSKKPNDSQELLDDKTNELAAKNKELKDAQQELGKVKKKLQNRQNKIQTQSGEINTLKKWKNKYKIIRKAQIQFWLWICLSVIAVGFAVGCACHIWCK